MRVIKVSTHYQLNNSFLYIIILIEQHVQGQFSLVLNSVPVTSSAKAQQLRSI